MAKENLTAVRIAAFQCPPNKSQAFLWDTAAPGLALRVTSNGSKAFIFQAKIKDGGEPRITIGDPATWRLPEAREQARKHKLLTDSGIDPRSVQAEKRAIEQAERTEQSQLDAKRTLLARTAWDAYLAAPHPKWGETHRTDHINAANEGGTDCKIGKRQSKAAPLASILNKPLYEITSSEVQKWLAQESISRATFAHNCYRKFRAFINWSATHPEFQHATHPDCCTASRVTDIVPRTKTKEADSLQRQQLATWFIAIKGLSNPVLSTYFQALLITGARRNEMTNLRWSDLDFKWSTMKLGDKIEESRSIPLTPYLAQILAALPRVNEWVFSSPTANSGHIESPTKAHTTAVKKGGLPHVSLHGLRRTFGTLAEWVDAPSGAVAQIMGHKPSAIAEKHYKRRSIDQLGEWHVKIESWLLQEAGITWNS